MGVIKGLESIIQVSLSGDLAVYMNTEEYRMMKIQEYQDFFLMLGDLFLKIDI